eukprot:tig00020629_g12422.t1
MLSFVASAAQVPCLRHRLEYDRLHDSQSPARAAIWSAAALSPRSPCSLSQGRLQASWHGKPLATTFEAGVRAWRRRRARLGERCCTVAEAPKPRLSVLPSSPLPAPRVFTEESFGAHEFGYDSLDFLRAKVGLTSHELYAIVRRVPAVLSLNASACIEPLIVLLLANDVPLASIRSGFRRFPRVLFCDAATIASRIAWLRSRGVDLPKLWRQCPQTLTLSEENLERKWAALSREIGADGARRVFEETIAPTLSVENLLGKLDEVQGALGVPRRELAALAARMPGLLEADVPARAGASFEYLGSLGLSRAEAAAVLRAVPRLLVSDIDACYSPAVSFLLSTGFSPSDVALLIRRRPTLHRFSVTKYYSPLVMFLSRQGIHGPALVRVLRLAPELLGHSIESLRPKFEFLYAQHYSARDIISYPTALKCSLERRIRPRLLFLAGRGLRAPLCRALTLRDERFAAEVARCRPEEWAAFLGRHAGGPAGTRGQDG